MVIPASRVAFGPIVKALSALIADDADGPKRLVRAVLYLWQKAEYPLLTTRTPRGTSPLLAQVPVGDFSSWLARQSFNEAAYWLATAYSYWVGDKVRTEQALYFTPPKLAERVIDDLVARGASLADSHWHDPACGGAAFLVPIAQRMAQAMTNAGLSKNKVLGKLQRQLSGSDLDKALLEISEHFLRMALYSYITTKKQIPSFQLRQTDGLLAPSRRGLLAPDVLACNPPYRKLKAAETEKYLPKFRDVIRNQPNMYGLFIRKTLDIVKPGGLIGLLTPTSFLSGASFSKLRTCLLERSDILHVDMLSDRTSMFISVEQETVISVLKARAHGMAPSPATDICVLSPQGKYHSVGTCRFSGDGSPWPVPRSVSDSDLLTASPQWTGRLKDYGYTPKVGHLVPYRDERRRFAVRPTGRPQNCIVPLVWATDITVQGLAHGRVTRQQRTDYFVEVSSAGHSSVHAGPSVVLQRLTSNDQEHRLVAAAVPAAWQQEHGGFVAENHVIVLQTVAGNPWPPELMARILNSSVINRLYRSISGAANVAVSELIELPFPSTSKLRKALEHSEDINKAIREAFSLSD
ncbi:MAG: Eco57I restriction-modification methylase domain-containing protein [Burkholderiales bacterium]